MEDLESFYEGTVEGLRENPLYKAEAPAPQSAPAPQAEEKKAGPAKAAAVKAAPVKKEPTKIKKGKTWEVCDYKNQKDPIKFEGADVDGSTSFAFYNCEKINVIIVGKFKTFLFSRCKQVKLTMDESISQGEIIKSERMKVHVNKRLP